jgi:hypothetical protein
MAWKKINLNDTVRVKYKPNGLEVLRKRHEELYQFVAARGGKVRPWESPEVDAEGYSREQLWQLFEIFGPCINLSCDPPFETALLIEVSDET